MEYDQDVFEVKLDVEKYEPNELSVKIQNEHLIVSGKHEKKSDEFGLVAQQFTRQFLMPEVSSIFFMPAFKQQKQFS